MRPKLLKSTLKRLTLALDWRSTFSLLLLYILVATGGIVVASPVPRANHSHWQYSNDLDTTSDQLSIRSFWVQVVDSRDLLDAFDSSSALMAVFRGQRIQSAFHCINIPTTQHTVFFWIFNCSAFVAVSWTLSSPLRSSEISITTMTTIPSDLHFGLSSYELQRTVLRCISNLCGGTLYPQKSHFDCRVRGFPTIPSGLTHQQWHTGLDMSSVSQLISRFPVYKPGLAIQLHLLAFINRFKLPGCEKCGAFCNSVKPAHIHIGRSGLQTDEDSQEHGGILTELCNDCFRLGRNTWVRSLYDQERERNSVSSLQNQVTVITLADELDGRYGEWDIDEDDY